MKNIKHLISITDLSTVTILKILKKAIKLKKTSNTKYQDILKSKTLAMIFEKPSLRTRLSFEIGMTQFGGHAIYLGPSDIGLGKREATSDIARVVSDMSNIIMARTFLHKTIIDLAANSSVPVINGLSDLEHPCQILADLMTVLEVKGRLNNLTIAYLGDAENNVVHSWCLAAALLGLSFNVGRPKGYVIKTEIVEKAKEISKKSGGMLFQTDDPKKAILNSDVVITDTWISMGDEAEKEKRLKIFKPYQINSKLFNLAKKDAIFMHCLPAYRGQEVTSDVIDSSRSVVFQEAENRLHAQKSLILYLLDKLND